MFPVLTIAPPYTAEAKASIIRFVAAYNTLNDARQAEAKRKAKASGILAQAVAEQRRRDGVTPCPAANFAPLEKYLDEARAGLQPESIEAVRACDFAWLPAQAANFAEAGQPETDVGYEPDAGADAEYSLAAATDAALAEFAAALPGFLGGEPCATGWSSRFVAGALIRALRETILGPDSLRM